MVDFVKAGCFLPGLWKVHKETCWCPLLAVTHSSAAQPVGLCQLQIHPGHVSLRALSSALHKSQQHHSYVGNVIAKTNKQNMP